ncbi:MAG TPA: hypothetical protein VGG64_01510 [Pirellulales bacterium]|jgi:hypothetical protein
MQFDLRRMLAAMVLVACASATLRWTSSSKDWIAGLAWVITGGFAFSAWGMLVQGYRGALKATFLYVIGLFWLPLLFVCAFGTLAFLIAGVRELF